MIKFYAAGAISLGDGEKKLLALISQCLPLSAQLALDTELADALQQGLQLLGAPQTRAPTGVEGAFSPQTWARFAHAAAPGVELSDGGRLLTMRLRGDRVLRLRLTADDPSKADFCRVQQDFLAQRAGRALVLDAPPVFFLDKAGHSFQYTFEGESLRLFLANYALDKETTLLKDGLVYSAEGGRTDFSFAANAILSFLRDAKHAKEPRCVFGDSLLEEAVRYYIATTSVAEAKRLFEAARVFYFCENSAFFRAAAEGGCEACGAQTPAPRDAMAYLLQSGLVRHDFHAPLFSAVVAQELLKGDVYAAVGESAAVEVVERLLEFEAQRRVTRARTFDFSRSRFVEAQIESVGVFRTSKQWFEEAEVEAVFDAVLGLESRHSFPSEEAAEGYEEVKRERLPALQRLIDLESWLGRADAAELARLPAQGCGAVGFLLGGSGPLVSEPKPLSALVEEAALAESAARAPQVAAAQPPQPQRKLPLKSAKRPSKKG